jgi:hypothetical protein
VAFCETFDAPAGNPAARSGDLNAELWGASRAAGSTNLGQGDYTLWQTTPLESCNGTTTVRPPNDIIICGGQLREAVTDGGTVTSLAMYPKQPFDFAGRTGTVVFDVANDTQGGHAAWPEFWLTDKPVPDPFVHEDSWDSVPANGLGISFAGCTNDQGIGFTCPRGSPQSMGVDLGFVINNSVSHPATIIGHDSVLIAPPGQMNHYELRISQDDVEIYGTDPFTPGTELPPIRHLASIPNAGLTLTKGLIWIEDEHYNGNKFDTQGTHTFIWDNVGFDGPKTYRDLSFDVPDANDGQNLGYLLSANTPRSFDVPGVFRRQTPTGALATFQWAAGDQTVPSFRVNGGPVHTTAWPFDATINTDRTIAVPIDVSEVHDGTNTIEFTSGTDTVVHNINLILVAGAPVP